MNFRAKAQHSFLVNSNLVNSEKQVTHWSETFGKRSGVRLKADQEMRVYYGVDWDNKNNLSVRLYHRRILAGKELLGTKVGVSEDDINYFDDDRDKEVLSILFAYQKGHYWDTKRRVLKLPIPQSLQKLLLSRMAETGRLFLDHELTQSQPVPLEFCESQLSIYVTEGADGDGYRVTGELCSGEQKWNINEISLVTLEGVSIISRYIISLGSEGSQWLPILLDLKNQNIPREEGDVLVQNIYSGGKAPVVEWPESLKWSELFLEPQPKLVIETQDQGGGGIYVQVRYMYGSEEVAAQASNQYIVDAENKTLYGRNLSLEEEYLKYMVHEGLSEPPSYVQAQYNFRLHKDQFLQVVNHFLEKGWKVMAYGKDVTMAKKFNVSVTSGIDGFDLTGQITFESGLLFLPVLLSSVKKGEELVALNEEQWATIPSKWLEKCKALSGIGKLGQESLRFTKAQGVFLNAYFSDEEDIIFDSEFKKFRANLKEFQSKGENQPFRLFQGHLREYQRIGLSWLESLKAFELGGILADDMGLGKTVQVLAFLQKEIRQKKRNKAPNLIVVPKSLVFNWKSEAEKFVPDLNVMAYVGTDRLETTNQFLESDIVITTYNILRIDYQTFSQVSFNYVILDEAQAIKNPKSQMSRACKRIVGVHRLALTGTPIENSILDLFSIMDFVNPGLVGRWLKKQFGKGSSPQEAWATGLEFLNRAFAPIILRRTKEEVLKDLPPKLVNTLRCELSEEERESYNHLKFHYQMNLSKKFTQQGFKKSKIEVLEALLRLRQISCHPGLINKEHRGRTSAKLEILLEQIEEVIDGGHKCLVFSQFTSFLRIVRDRLDDKKVKYCYLDGQTSRRQEVVDTFQKSAEFKIFLISLKAGGQGLNLTSADYVFILDPWWNPAAESQAIDRSHRIGQDKKVIAYKLIAKGTVEEKILQLQERKKHLSDAIVDSDAGVLKKLTLDELNFLLE